jgi:hypothetical protein
MPGVVIGQVVIDIQRENRVQDLAVLDGVVATKVMLQS